MNGTTQQCAFERTHANDCNDAPVYFNDYRNPKWWSMKRHREWLAERVMPWIFSAALLGAIAFVGWVDAL